MVVDINEEQNDSQVMEEDPENIDIGELDIQSLEQACRTKFFDKNLDQQVEDLEEILSRAQRKKSLGIQNGSPWDGRVITKDIKKRGRKTDLQRTIRIGEMLVDSGRYSKLTKYHDSLQNYSQ